MPKQVKQTKFESMIWFGYSWLRYVMFIPSIILSLVIIYQLVVSYPNFGFNVELLTIALLFWVLTSLFDLKYKLFDLK